MGLVVSFTADAGQDPSLGASRFEAMASATTLPSDLVPRVPTDALIVPARLSLGAPAEIDEGDPEIEPNRAVKPAAHAFPAVDRTGRGDPFVGLRPSFDARLRAPGGLERVRVASLVFSLDGTGLNTAFTPAEGDAPGPDSVSSFEPWPDGAPSTPSATRSNPSPGAGGAAALSGGTEPPLSDGASPAVPRATALSSSTPAAADGVPVEMAVLQSLPRGWRGEAPALRAPDQPNYAALIDEDKAAREQKCLAEAIYFEARSEPEEGQAAVAQVVLNRVRSGLYPPSVCGVVYQNRQRRNACQFSFACEGHALHVTEGESWQSAVRIAHAVTEGTTYLADVGAATHYHADYVRPRWAKRLQKTDVIGRHIFYTLRPGQT